VGKCREGFWRCIPPPDLLVSVLINFEKIIIFSIFYVQMVVDPRLFEMDCTPF